MPKTRFDRFAQPKRDLVWALISERLKAKNVTSEQGAKLMGRSRSSYYNRLNQNTDEWSLGEVRRMCSGLKVEIEANEAELFLRCLGISIRKET